MNEERHDAETGAEHDAVAEFFAAARGQVRDERATDLDWQRILSGSRRSSRRRNRLAMLSSAAVAIIAIFAVFLWQQNGIGGGVQRGEAIVGATDKAQSGEPTSSPSSVSPQQQPTSVPDSFRTWSVSYAGQSVLYALGSQACGGDTCPVLLKSGTNGRSWAAVHKFTGTDVSAATGNAVPQIQPQRALSQTRFATPSTGYVFGGDLWVTRDSGASFTKMSHPGTTVLDVEINQGQAVLLSADNCGQGECNGPIHVTRFDPAKGSISDSGVEMTPSSPIRAGNVVVQNGQAFVQLTAVDGAKPVAPLRLDGSKLTAMSGPSDCGGTALQSVTPATNNSTQVQLFALCKPTNSGTSHTSYTIVSSDDAGKSWKSVSSGALTLPRLGQVWLAAADAKHLVASAGGPREIAGVPAPNGDGSLMFSTNGQGFGPATTPKGAKVPATGFDWTASAGGGIFYAVPRATATPGFWTTTDYGKTWTLVDPRHQGN
ncbi:WD40/YVTN/BNR-like repeat-containing protein [Flexivirga alba]|uniref:WD40/YVTN/BNR-like repeat-containing protein n=1 Tax=Flexivirga alba TaxID=702742 RepID=A0ABW2AHM1_9MICO